MNDVTDDARVGMRFTCPACEIQMDKWTNGVHECSACHAKLLLIHGDCPEFNNQVGPGWREWQRYSIMKQYKKQAGSSANERDGLLAYTGRGRELRRYRVDKNET